MEARSWYDISSYRKEFERVKVLFKRECGTGQYLGSNIKLSEFVERRIKGYAEKQLKVRTITFCRDLMKQVTPALGHIRLSKLQPHHPMKFYGNLAEEAIRDDGNYLSKINLAEILLDKRLTQKALAAQAGVSIKTVYAAVKGEHIRRDCAEKVAQALGTHMHERFLAAPTKQKALAHKTILHYHRFLSSMLNIAVHWQIILANPCSRAKPSKLQHKETCFLDDEQVAEMFAHLADESITLQTIATVLVCTGLQRGELNGLK